MSTAIEVEESSAVITAYGQAFAKAGAAAFNGPRDKLGETIVRLTLEFFEDSEWQPKLIETLRTANNSKEGAEVMGNLFSAQVFAQAGVIFDDAPLTIDELSDKLGINPLNINSSAAQLWGVFLFRYVLGVQPLASASVDQIVEVVAPTLQRYIVG
ncbi:hypothetical protein NMG29_11785 [Streptomyces cocklensis]|uniref:TetR_C_16 domain-containing protein n=1 Tax=Actinacidiphila cocklensis TaxID=887465 RepID=A0A9W4DUK9_9ACTN|nr:hypothetical protein [Actinacidiphila cocklensis]MDD1058884.1 hypothetical protein [Actinacidiphila cocklensis]WSX73587.1 hypothetical protein OH826_06805 [Streptomyces sp. NBC_00899]WSX80349.1 hypothetical protein OH826_44705 [Streptomyces sp. NBC_00899]CAG6396468.1 TetR_C_16 domain-containing protein [Actinacidiphila cocklensis]